jgi:hypothetical protein
MRTLVPFIVLGVVGAAPLALADAWQAKAALEPGSPPDCKQADVSHLLFDLADTGNELSVKTSSGGRVFGSDWARWFRQDDVRGAGWCEELFRRPYRECEDAGNGSIQQAVLLPLQAHTPSIGPVRATSLAVHDILSEHAHRPQWLVHSRQNERRKGRSAGNVAGSYASLVVDIAGGNRAGGES